MSTEYVVFAFNGVVSIDTREQFNDSKAKGRTEERASFEVADDESFPQLVGKDYRAATVHDAEILSVEVKYTEKVAIAVAVVSIDGSIENVPAIVAQPHTATDHTLYELLYMGGAIFAMQRPKDGGDDEGEQPEHVKEESDRLDYGLVPGLVSGL